MTQRVLARTVKTLSAAAAAVALLLLSALPARAAAPVNADRKGVAIKGYDPVGYFTDGKPVKGSAEHEHSWNGATWRFASAANRDLFAADPEKYAPRYGGYCAYAVANGSTAGIDPDAWSIVDDKLYLNYSRSVQERWSEDIPGNVARADANWPRLKDAD